MKGNGQMITKQTTIIKLKEMKEQLIAFGMPIEAFNILIEMEQHKELASSC